MTWLIVAAIVALLFAGLPALLYARNVRPFRAPALSDNELSRPPASVLIPARNEETGIGRCLESVLASRGVNLEVIVLDDHSTDRTAVIVQEFATRDSRVRFASAPPLPADWAGKQHACFTLSKLAKYDAFSFLDADVRLAPDGLARMLDFLRTSHADLASGFPRQETGTILEKLLIPLIHWLLLCYLPIDRMRTSRQPGLGAGCGQWFTTTRSAYTAVGGHSAVKGSYHDGVKLPRAYRMAGFATDFCDATELATCRMYRTGSQVWNGLAKNAREGLAAPKLIVFATMLLFCGQILPFLVLAFAIAVEDWGSILIAIIACLLAFAPRCDAAMRFHQSWVGAILHPLGIVLLLAIQWYATVRAVVGRPVGWKGRAHPSLSSAGGSSIAEQPQ